MRLTVATLNLKKGELEWGRRAPWLLQQLAEMRPDIIAFQEVDLRIDQGNWIRSRLNDLLHDPQSTTTPYVIHHIANPREQASLEAVAVMTRRPVAGHEGFDYLFRNRVAQRVLIGGDAEQLHLYNTHFHHEVGTEHDAIRLRQATQLLAWIEARSAGAPRVLVGDLNAMPGSPVLDAFGSSLTSAFEDAGLPPPTTTLSPIEEQSADIPRGISTGAVLDHIVVGGELRVIDARVVFDAPDPKHPGVYASDHVGLCATIEVGSAAQSARHSPEAPPDFAVRRTESTRMPRSSDLHMS